MKCARTVLLAFWLMALLAVPASALASYLVESALENPASLIYLGEDQVLYAATTLETPSSVLAYAEYDPFAGGYGALVMRFGDSIAGRFVGEGASGTEDITTWSYIGAKSVGSFGVGLAVNRASGTENALTVDAGVILNWRALTVGFAVRRIGVESGWLISYGDTVSGIGLHISDSVSIEVDAVSATVPVYRVTVAAGRGPITARLYAIGARDSELDPGIDIRLTRDVLTVNLGCQLEKETNENTIRFGLGYSF